jgi:hypothetical protein
MYFLHQCGHSAPKQADSWESLRPSSTGSWFGRRRSWAASFVNTAAGLQISHAKTASHTWSHPLRSLQKTRCLFLSSTLLMTQSRKLAPPPPVSLRANAVYCCGLTQVLICPPTQKSAGSFRASGRLRLLQADFAHCKGVYSKRDTC